MYSQCSARVRACRSFQPISHCSCRTVVEDVVLPNLFTAHNVDLSQYKPASTPPVFKLYFTPTNSLLHLEVLSNRPNNTLLSPSNYYIVMLLLSSPRALQHSWRSSHENPIVIVQTCDRKKQNPMFVDYVPLCVLEQHAPASLDLIEADALDCILHLHLRIAQHEHIRDIEVRGLKSMLSHWVNTAHDSYPPPFPRCKTVGEAVLLYRALQILQVPQAEILRGRIMNRMHRKAVTSMDVQQIWRTFHHLPEWTSWLDALMCNLVHFRILQNQPDGGYIELFIETEMMQCDDVKRAQIVTAYQRYSYVPNTSWYTRLRHALRRILRAGY